MEFQQQRKAFVQEVMPVEAGAADKLDAVATNAIGLCKDMLVLGSCAGIELSEMFKNKSLLNKEQLIGLAQVICSLPGLNGKRCIFEVTTQ